MPVLGSFATKNSPYKDRIQKLCFFLLRKKTRALPHFTLNKQPFSFQNILYKKPTYDIYILRNLQGQLLGFCFLLAFKSRGRVNLPDIEWYKFPYLLMVHVTL